MMRMKQSCNLLLLLPCLVVLTTSLSRRGYGLCQRNKYLRHYLNMSSYVLSHLEADRLQQKIMWGSSPVSQGSPKLKTQKNTASYNKSGFLLRPTVGSEFGINNMNPWTYPALCQQCRWWCNGAWNVFLVHFGPFNTNHNHGLNATATLSIVVDQMHPFMTTIYSLLMATSSMSQSKSCLKLVSWTWLEFKVGLEAEDRTEILLSGIYHQSSAGPGHF